MDGWDEKKRCSQARKDGLPGRLGAPLERRDRAAGRVSGEAALQTPQAAETGAGYVVVCGPTATGKTDLALALARRFGGEVVNADSMQVYQGLVIGTAAASAEEVGEVPLHLSGFLPPEEAFSVAAWLKAARACLAEIAGRGKLPIVCGGTGLYIKSLAEGIAFEEEAADRLRQGLEAEWDKLGGEAMLQRLAQRDPARAAELHVKDRKRILRALELIERTGQTDAERRKASQKGAAGPKPLCLGLDWPERAALYAAIEARVDRMMAVGLLEEARWVYEHRGAWRTAVQAIGYKEFFPYFEGEAALEDCVAKLKQATRNYAKRQRTWFYKMEAVHWLAAGEAGGLGEAERLVAAYWKG